MTGYTVHTGSNDKFSKGWDQIFPGGKQASKTTESQARASKASKKTAKKGKKSKQA